MLRTRIILVMDVRAFVLGLAMAASVVCASQAADDPPARRDYSLEVGALIGHNSNVLNRANADDAPVPTATLSTLYLTSSARRKWLTAYMDARSTTFSSDVEVMDHQMGLAGLTFSPRSTRITAEYLFMPSKVSSEDGEETFFELHATQLKVRQGRSRGVWAEVSYKVEEWTFDAAHSNRAADARKAAITLRVPVGGPVGLRLSYLREAKEALDPQYNWQGDGATLALEARPGDRIQLSILYRQRQRSYDDLPPLADNFERQDTVRDAALDLRAQIGRHWGVRLDDAWVEVASTHPGRSFHTIEASAGVFFNF